MVCFGYTVKLSLSTHDRQRTPQNRTRFQNIAVKRFLSVFARRLSKTDEYCEPAIVGKEGKYMPVSHPSLPSLKNFNLRCQFNFGMTGKTLLTDGKEKASLEDYFIYF